MSPARFLIAVALLGVAAVPCRASVRYLWGFPRPACEVARDAELIVVGHLKRDYIAYHTTRLSSTRYFITRYAACGTLVITRVAAGRCDQLEIPIFFPGTAIPVVGGKLDWDLRPAERFVRVHSPDAEPNMVRLYCLGRATVLAEELGDLCEDHVWFLNEKEHLPGLRQGEMGWALEQGDGVVPVDELDYYLAFRARDVKAALLAVRGKYLSRADKIDSFLAFENVRRYKAIKDPVQQAHALLPICMGRLDGYPYCPRRAAQAAFRELGPAAASEGLRALSETTDRSARSFLLSILGDEHYEPAAGPLVDLLRAQNIRLKSQPIPADASKRESPEVRLFEQFVDETHEIVDALRQIASPQARDVLRESQRVWRDFPQIVASCREALAAIQREEQIRGRAF